MVAMLSTMYLKTKAVTNKIFGLLLHGSSGYY